MVFALWLSMAIYCCAGGGSETSKPLTPAQRAEAQAMKDKACNTVQRLTAAGGFTKIEAERTHSGKYCYGKTPMQTFLDAKPLADAKDDREGVQRAGTFHRSKPAVRRLLTVRSSFGYYILGS